MKAWARCRCGGISRSGCVKRPIAAAWCIHAPAMAAAHRVQPKNPGARTSCTARRWRCCPRCCRHCASMHQKTDPGCSATATAARSPCCLPLTSGNRWPVPSCWRRTSRSKTWRWPASPRPARPIETPTCAAAWRATTTTPIQPSGAGMTSGCSRSFATGPSPPRSARSPARCWRCRAWTTNTARWSRSAASPAVCRRPSCWSCPIAATRHTATSPMP